MIPTDTSIAEGQEDVKIPGLVWELLIKYSLASDICCHMLSSLQDLLSTEAASSRLRVHPIGIPELEFLSFFSSIISFLIGDITAMRTRSWNKRRHYSTDTDSYKLSKHFINTSYISIQILVRVHQPENGCTKRELIWMSVPRFPFPRFTRLGSYTQNSLSSFYCWKNH